MARRRGRDKAKPPVDQRPSWTNVPRPATRTSGSSEEKAAAASPVAAGVSVEEQLAEAARELAALGQRRLRLVGQLKEVDGDLRPVVIKATQAGLPYRRIEELTGVSHATVGRWART